MTLFKHYTPAMVCGLISLLASVNLCHGQLHENYPVWIEEKSIAETIESFDLRKSIQTEDNTPRWFGTLRWWLLNERWYLAEAEAAIERARAQAGIQPQERKENEQVEIPSHAEVAEVLLEATKHPDPATRAAAAFSLGRMNRHEAVERLIELASEDKSLAVRRGAYIALGLIGNGKAKAFLRQPRPVIVHDMACRIMAVSLLSGDAEETRKVLLDLLNQPKDTVDARWLVAKYKKLARPQTAQQILIRPDSREMALLTQRATDAQRLAMIAVTPMIPEEDRRAFAWAVLKRSADEFLADQALTMLMGETDSQDTELLDRVFSWWDYKEYPFMHRIELLSHIENIHLLLPKPDPLRERAAQVLGHRHHLDRRATRILTRPLRGDRAFRSKHVGALLRKEFMRKLSVWVKMPMQVHIRYYTNQVPDPRISPLIALGHRLDLYEKHPALDQLLEIIRIPFFNTCLHPNVQRPLNHGWPVVYPPRDTAIIGLGLHLRRLYTVPEHDSTGRLVGYKAERQIRIIRRRLADLAKKDDEMRGIRSTAVLALAIAGHPQDIPLIDEALANIPPDQRAMDGIAVLALGMFGDPRAVAGAKPLLDNPIAPRDFSMKHAVRMRGLPPDKCEIGRRLVQGISLTDHPDVVPLLLGAYGHDYFVSQEVVRGLRMQGDKQIARTLVELLRNPPQKRVESIQRAYNEYLWYPQTVEHLEVAAANPWSLAAWSLGELMGSDMNAERLRRMSIYVNDKMPLWYWPDTPNWHFVFAAYDQEYVFGRYRSPLSSWMIHKMNKWKPYKVPEEQTPAHDE